MEKKFFIKDHIEEERLIIQLYNPLNADDKRWRNAMALVNNLGHVDSYWFRYAGHILSRDIDTD